MNHYYKECLKKGLEYQDFVANKLIENLGLPVTSYSSTKYQYDVGENRQGFEIKFDDRYKKTGNIYIEVSEKTDARNKEYIKSGIFRNDNTWLYIIGDYETIFIFGKNILQGLYNSGEYKKVETPTSRGFLLNKKGQSYASKIIKINN